MKASCAEGLAGKQSTGCCSETASAERMTRLVFICTVIENILRVTQHVSNGVNAVKVTSQWAGCTGHLYVKRLGDYHIRLNVLILFNTSEATSVLRVEFVYWPEWYTRTLNLWNTKISTVTGVCKGTVCDWSYLNIYWVGNYIISQDYFSQPGHTLPSVVSMLSGHWALQAAVNTLQTKVKQS